MRGVSFMVGVDEYLINEVVDVMASSHCKSVDVKHARG